MVFSPSDIVRRGIGRLRGERSAHDADQVVRDQQERARRAGLETPPQEADPVVRGRVTPEGDRDAIVEQVAKQREAARVARLREAVAQEIARAYPFSENKDLLQALAVKRMSEEQARSLATASPDTASSLIHELAQTLAHEAYTAYQRGLDQAFG